MATVWLLCGYCVATVWLLCGCCVATVWLLCGYCVATVWLLCCILWIRMKPMSMTERRTHVRMHKRALHKHLRTGIFSPNVSDACLVVQRIRFWCMSRIPRSLSTMTLCMIDTRVRTQLLTEWEHAHDEIPSQCERTKRSFADMSCFTILPPFPRNQCWG